jgi:signal transduction histidine kinase
MSVQPFAGETRAAESGPSSAADPDSHVKTQLLRRIAHDIASPTGVTMTVLDELMTEGKPRPELVAMARRSLRRLMRLSEQLAVLSELESDGIEPELATIDLRVATKQALDDALAIDGRKDVVAASDVPASHVWASADQRLLVSVLREVVGNALRLASSRIEVSLRVTDDHAIFRVDDDGPGFSEEALATLGKRFVRRTARGLGLSLSIAMDILRAHGGTLSLETSALPPNRRGATGSAVIVTLPLRSPIADAE